MGEIIPFINREAELLGAQIADYLHLLQQPALSLSSKLIPFPNNHAPPYIVTQGGWRTFLSIPYQPLYPHDMGIFALTISLDDQPYVFSCFQRSITSPDIVIIGFSYRIPDDPGGTFLQFYANLHNQRINTDLFVYPSVTRNPHPLAPHTGFAPIPTSIYLLYTYLRDQYNQPHFPWHQQSERQFWQWLIHATRRHYNFLHSIHPAIFPSTHPPQPAEIKQLAPKTQKSSAAHPDQNPTHKPKPT